MKKLLKKHKLPFRKTRCGFDGISTKLLKLIKTIMVKLLTLTINQILYTGVFPIKLEIAYVIHIFKKNDPPLFKNY